jgi:Putative amidoligase enzyme
MLKFYSFSVSSLTPCTHSGARGRYFLVSNGKHFTAYNESSYSTMMFADRPYEIPVGDDAYTDLLHAVQNVAYLNISRNARVTASQAADYAEAIASTLVPMSEVEMVQIDHHAYKRILENLLGKFLPLVQNYSYAKRVNWERRIDKFVDARVDRIMRKAGLRSNLYAHYKNHQLREHEIKNVMHFRKQIGAYVAQGVQHDDWHDDIFYYLKRLYGYSSMFVDSDFLAHLSNLSNGQASYEICDCGHIEVASETHDVRNDTWCESCFRDDAVHVEDQDEYWPRDDAYYHESDDLYYSYEPSYDNDDDDNDEEPSGLMSYSTNVLRHLERDVSIHSGPFGNFTLGVELEMCAGGRSSMRDAIEDVRDQLGEDYCIAKSDGSLPSDGFEIVTAPRGLDEHIRRFKSWQVKSGYRAWNAGTCGLHVHIDSRAFTPMTLGKFLMFINDDNNADFIRSLAGRHPKTDTQARHYCAADDQSVLTNPKTAVKGKDSARYRMVNVCNMDRDEMTRLGIDHYKFDTSGRKFNTVELRIFRASLKKERLLAQIEFTHAAVMFVRSASYRDLTHGAFKGWLAKSYALYPHLAAWYEVAPKKKANPNTVAVVSADETVA